MVNFDDVKIREVLKNVFGLFKYTKDFIFTTYDFDREFFEEHIISYLMDLDKKINKINELNLVNKWIHDNNLSIYYDSGATKIIDSFITLPMYPKIVEHGVFHPKVIILYGEIINKNKDSLYLIVSSCNLTVNGYGRNMEAFSCIEVESRVVADNLLAFIEKISENDAKRHAELKRYLRGHNFNNSKDVEFIWSYGTKGNNLLSVLSKLPKGDMKIVSPYFDEKGPGQLLNKINGKGNVCIYPAIENSHYNIRKSEYKVLKKSGIKFACVSGNDDESRFIHAKIIIKGRCICVGSYNFTSAALKQKNAEAALLFHDVSKNRFAEYKINENCFLSDKDKIEDQDNTRNNDFNGLVIVTVDYDKNKVFIEAEKMNKKQEYYLTIEGLNEWSYKIYNTEEEPIEIELNDSMSNAFNKHKRFNIYQKTTKKKVYSGYINEINWVGKRQEIGCDTLEDAIREWITEGSTKRCVENSGDRFINNEEKEINEIVTGKKIVGKDIFDNYYSLSSGFEKIISDLVSYKKEREDGLKIRKRCEREKQIEEAENKIYDIFYVRAASLLNIIKHAKTNINEIKEKDDVYYWLIIRYINKINKILPKKLIYFDQYKVNLNKFKKIFDELCKKIELNISGKVDNKYLEWIEKEIFVYKE